MMNERGIPVSRWIDGVLEDKENLVQPDNTRAMVLWGHAPNSQTRMVEMKDAMEKLDLLVVVDPYPTVSAILHDRQDLWEDVNENYRWDPGERIIRDGDGDGEIDYAPRVKLTIARYLLPSGRSIHRELDDERSTHLRPFLRHERELKLGDAEIVPVDIEILPSSTRFSAGESLVLQISGMELAGAGDIAHSDPVNRGVHVVHIGGEHNSHLLLPVIHLD